MLGPITYFHYPIGPMLLRKTGVQRAPTFICLYFDYWFCMVVQAAGCCVLESADDF